MILRKCIKYLILFVLLNLLCFTIKPARIIRNEIFSAHRAGEWYPKNAHKLTNLIKTLEKDASERYAMDTDAHKIKALVCPHAAYEYSGVIAAAVYNLVKTKNFDRVIILAPSHFVPFKGITLPPFTHYRTPLGILTLDQQIIHKLARHTLSLVAQNAFNPEHALEVQLPFIQRISPKVELIPVMVGSLAESSVSEIAALLKQFITPTTLVIVSSDMTHYGKNFEYTPFNNDTNNLLLQVRQLDSTVLSAVQHQDLAEFQNALKATSSTICGREPLRVLLSLIDKNAFGKTATRLVAYATSADATQDETNIVSYAGLIVTQDLDTTLLNKQEQNSLLEYSRATLEQAFSKKIDPERLKPIMTPVLEKPTGAFVTLWEPLGKPSKTLKINKKEAAVKPQKKLRGCIGQITSKEPLYKTVADMTHAAAFRDARFEPLTQEELKNVTLEISVLKPAYSIKSYRDIILNKHGIILTIGKASALFLPKVPSEFGFDLTRTLEELSIKAGLDKNAWKLPTAKFHVFETQDFQEKHS